MSGFYDRYPSLPLKPLDFDDCMSDDENDENNAPATSTDEDVKAMSYSPEQTLLNESTMSISSIGLSSESLLEFHKKVRRGDFQNSTPGAIRATRKRKYCEPVTSDTSLLHMPNEILNRVFSFCNKRDLLAAGSTCKRFYDVTSNEKHWTTINLCGKRVLESALHRMISRKTKTLCMISSVVFLDPLLSSRAFASCSLTRLDLSWAKFPGSDLAVMKGILSRCTQLEYLALESQTIDAEVLQIVAKNVDLLVLNLSSCQIIDAAALSLVFKSCNKLKDLNLSWTHPDQATATVIINEIPKTVEKFAISGMIDRIAFNDTGMIKILARLPNLTELDIGDNNIVTSTFLLELATRKNFRKLTACRCYAIEPITYTTLKYVRAMNLFGAINNSGYDYMKNALPGVSFNLNPFTTIARSQESNQSIFWGIDISEPY